MLYEYLDMSILCMIMALVVVFLCIYFRFVLFFFFKQKTAYEMRISDWSSDVCSSDLNVRALYRDVAAAAAAVARLMAQPVTPSMLEFMDGDCVRLTREHMQSATGSSDLPDDAGARLMIEADGAEATLPAAIAALQPAATGGGLLEVAAARDGASRAR